jgi:hypothetical protein
LADTRIITVIPKTKLWRLGILRKIRVLLEHFLIHRRKKLPSIHGAKELPLKELSLKELSLKELSMEPASEAATVLCLLIPLS